MRKNHAQVPPPPTRKTVAAMQHVIELRERQHSLVELLRDFARRKVQEDRRHAYIRSEAPPFNQLPIINATIKSLLVAMHQQERR